MLCKKNYFIEIINHKLKTCKNQRHTFLQSVLPCKSSFAACSSSSSYIDVSFAAKYDSKTVEANKYQQWEKDGYFSPKLEDDKVDNEVFTMILPPPNITGTLHLGHALTITVQDILCRWKRMQGIPVLWIPGTDHAGIATQIVVEKNLAKRKGLQMHDVGREHFLEEISEWKQDKERKINDQIKRLGASLDWSRYSFTLDEKQSNIVQEVLIKMFDDGLIYRKNAFVNWCSYLRSTISDIEIDYVPVEGPTYFTIPGYDKPVKFGTMIEFAYKVCDSEDEICVATTRLETICGDVAVVINPNDSRYFHLHGKFVWHPFRKCKLPIILDESAVSSLGTGAFKLTPGHSKIDYEIAKRHNLPVVFVINEAGCLNENCGEWANMSKYKARDLILQKLQDLDLYRSTKNHNTVIPICNRSGDVVEHMLKLQWFIKMSDISQKSTDAIKNHKLRIKPKSMKNVIQNWLEYKQDWCLSRQIWWGHKLPFFETEHGWVSARSYEEAREKSEKKFSKPCKIIVQEEDVIDTWFSSALLPFSVFGSPNSENNDFKKYYPLNVMETGRDIACLWVARMLMLGLHFTDKVPFKKVIFHGLVCDAYGRKMSKSLGNVIELNHVTDGISLKELHETVYANHKNGILSNEELQNALTIQKTLFSNGIPACGADALRFTLVSHDIMEPSIYFNIEECQRNTNFCNKMWQAFRFSITWANKFSIHAKTPPNPIFPWHYWLLHKVAVAVETCNLGLEEMQFNDATSTLKNFFINDLCDFYLEASKFVFHNGSKTESEATASVLIFCLETYLRLLAPIMPYISEELYSYVPGTHLRITDTFYPKPEDVWEQYQEWRNNELEEELMFIRNIITRVRALQAEVKSYTKNEVVIVSSRKEVIEKYIDTMKNLLRCSIQFQESDTLQEPAIANTVQSHTKIYLKFKTELENLSGYVQLLEFKKKKVTKNINFLNEKFSNEKYIAKTSEEKKKIHQIKVKELRIELDKIEELMESIQKFK